MRLPPAEAVDYFEQQHPKVTRHWAEIPDELRARIFTVANVTRLDVLQAIHDELTLGVEGKVGFSEFKKRLIPTLQEKGWWGRAIDKETGEVLESYHGTSVPVLYGDPWRLKLIYDVNLQSSFMAGRRARQLENVEERPYWMYLAVNDSRTRPFHRILHGKVFRYDDPFWESFYPPNGFRCRCRAKTLSEDRIGTGPGKILLSDSTGRLDKIKVPISTEHPEMGTIQIARYEYMTGKYVTTDPGWSHAPGATWEPNLDRYDPKLVEQYRKAMAAGMIN